MKHRIYKRYGLWRVICQHAGHKVCPLYYGPSWFYSWSEALKAVGGEP